jgi:Na+/H+-dicarboxylate symporter
MSKPALHYQILIGILLGALIGYVASGYEAGPGIITNWVKPIGDIFIRLLKVLAVPLIFVSLTKGISDLKDLSTLSINEVMLKMVDVIINLSPIAVVALMATLFAETSDAGIIKALISYAGVLLFGMAIMLAIYPLLVRWVTGMPMLTFMRGILPAQLVALSTSNLPLALAMILAVDRPLDMCRTVVNISGDSYVAVLVGGSLEAGVERR